MVDNGNGTFTYTNENGATTTITVRDTVVTTLTDNNDGTFTYTSEDGTVTTFNAKDTVITTLVDNGDSTFTYTNENGTTTTIDFGIENRTNELIDSVVLNRDDTLRIYEGGNVTPTTVVVSNTMAEIYDAAGGQTIGSSFTNVTMATNGIVDADYTAGANSITVDKSGRYKITYRVTLGFHPESNNRSEAEHQITRNGLAVPGTFGATYHRNAGANKGSTTIIKVIDLSAGDVIRGQSRQSAGSSVLQTVGNGTSLIIERL